MKYISVDVKLGNEKSGITKRMVVVFPEDLVHSIVAKGILYSLWEQYPTATLAVHAAGFTDAYMNKAYDSSVSMNLKADPTDAARFNLSNYGGNVL